MMNGTQPDGLYIQPAWDGQVVFIVLPYVNLFGMIVGRKIYEAIPTDNLSGVEALFLSDFVDFVTLTQDVQFHLTDDSPVMLRRLQAFWTAAQQPDKDWSSLWQLFLQTASMELREEWRKAINGAELKELAAPPELATPLPDDDAELEALPDDSPLSASGGASTARPSKSSRRKNERNATARP